MYPLERKNVTGYKLLKCITARANVSLKPEKVRNCHWKLCHCSCSVPLERYLILFPKYFIPDRSEILPSEWS